MSAATAADGSGQALREAAARGRSFLSRLQSEEGGWPNLLEAGAHLDALHGLFAWFLDRRDHPFQPSLNGTWATRLLQRQNGDGGFALWRGGPSDAEATFDAWLALRLAGLEPGHAGLRRAAQWLAAHGVSAACSPFTLLRYSWAGAADGRRVPAVAPEHYYFHDYSRWPALQRQQDVCAAALSIAAYLRGTDALRSNALPPAEHQEPWVRSVAADLRPGGVAGTLVAKWARLAPRPLRDPIVFRAYDAMVEEALRWPVLPVALHAALAVQSAGWRGSHALGRLERVVSMLGPSGPEGCPRPCDYGIRAAALAALALAGSDAASRAAGALKMRFRRGPASNGNGMLPAGWPLGGLHEDADAETTALALLALRSVNHLEDGMAREAADALMQAQRGDGGWSVSEADPSSPDVTGAVIEALIACGQSQDAPAVRRAVQFLEDSQHAEAWWRGSRGICRLYGTAMALRGLRAAGLDDREASVLRAGEWLRSIQNADGGWGEHPESHGSGEFREAASTPEQTAWALLGLLAGGDTDSESVRRGFAWLAANQQPGGGWAACAPTLAGVAYAPYLADPLGAAAWPLLALRERLNISL
ncbi:MAG: hypothetical protein NZR01_05780 [Bryobacteraceae bacterium]|nr:hypothetical protein [Bryobacteraceae bacterium]